MIDLHCHLLPGVDDGPLDMDEAVLMARMAEADGCEAVVATPHQRHPSWWNGDREELAGLRRELQARLGERPRVLAGAEIRVGGDLMAEIDLLPEGNLLPIAGSSYLLLELPRGEPAIDPLELVHEVTVAGFRPVLAHPEHYPWLVAERALLERLVDRGALLQVTAMSVTGAFGRRAHEACRELLDRNLVHFVASDAHGIDHRVPGLTAARATIAERWGAEVAHALTSGNPAAVIENRPLPWPVPA